MTFFTTEIRNHDNPSYLRDLESISLKPVRYLFEGRTIEILRGEIVKDCPSFGKRTYKGLALAIATLIPGIILGILSEIFNTLFNAQYAKDKDLITAFSAKKMTLPEAPKNRTLADYGKEFWNHAQPILDQIQEKEDIWKDKTFIRDFSEVMENGYRFMELYFQELHQKCGDDVDAIKREMILQPQNRSTPGQDYCHTFFGFTSLYHQARSCATRLDRKEWGERMGIGLDEAMPLREKNLLTPEDQEPYFNPTQPQYRWRQLYNAFCALVDKDGLRSKLEEIAGDKRFSKWSRPDTYTVPHYYFPDTTPT